MEIGKFSTAYLITMIQGNIDKLLIPNFIGEKKSFFINKVFPPFNIQNGKINNSSYLRKGLENVTKLQFLVYIFSLKIDPRARLTS